MPKQIHAGPIDAKTKGQVRRLRLNGFVPISVQHRGEPTLHLQSRAHALDEIIHKHGSSPILDLVVEPGGKTKQVLIHDLQRDPISRKLLHVTLQTIIKGEPIKTHIGIRLVGEPDAVKHGNGILQHATETLEIRAVPANLPDHLTVDISGLDVGDSIRVSDLPPASGYEVLTQPDTVIASITRLRLPEVEEKPAAEEPAEAEAAESTEAAEEAG